MTINNAAIPSDWKRATVVPIYKGGDRSLVTNYRPVSLTMVVCKQKEHITVLYLRQVWDRYDWLYEGQHGIRPRYSCESQVTLICQDIADLKENEVMLDAITCTIDFLKAFDLAPHNQLCMKIVVSAWN
jgi:hypothetical protein